MLDIIFDITLENKQWNYNIVKNSNTCILLSQDYFYFVNIFWTIRMCQQDSSHTIKTLNDS